jgi:hypothetical protein
MSKRLLLTAGLGLLVLLAPVAAFAQKSEGPKAKLMAKYDLNKNGVIDGDEIAAVRKAFAAEPTGDLKRFDTDKDGKLSDEEIALIKPPGGKAGSGEKKKGGAKKADAAKPEETAAPAAAATPAPAAPEPAKAKTS